MNLATFCTTWVEPEVRQLMADSLDKNIIDKDEYPQTAELENRCVHMLADLFHAPDAAGTIGTSTTGSSEAAMLGGLAAKWTWKAKRIAAENQQRNRTSCADQCRCAGKSSVDYFDVETRQVPMDDRYVMTPEEAVAQCDENTMAVVVTFGQTFTGLFENVAAISAALDALQARTGLDIPHLRGCSQRRLRRAVLRTRHPVGLPAASREVDQRVRTQDGARPDRQRLGHLARTRRTFPTS